MNALLRTRSAITVQSSNRTEIPVISPTLDKQLELLEAETETPKLRQHSDNVLGTLSIVARPLQEVDFPFTNSKDDFDMISSPKLKASASEHLRFSTAW